MNAEDGRRLYCDPRCDQEWLCQALPAVVAEQGNFRECTYTCTSPSAPAAAATATLPSLSGGKSHPERTLKLFSASGPTGLPIRFGTNRRSSRPSTSVEA